MNYEITMNTNGQLCLYVKKEGLTGDGYFNMKVNDVDYNDIRMLNMNKKHMDIIAKLLKIPNYSKLNKDILLNILSSRITFEETDEN